MGGVVGGVIGAVSGLVGSNQQANAVQSAADTSAGASRYAADVQKQMFDRQVELQEPWRQAGRTALNRLSSGLGTGGEFDQRFNMATFGADPGYAFRLSEGMNALNKTAAARGGLLSGAALRGAQRYGQDLGTQEYQNAFNRYYREREAMLNPLQSLAGVGQTSAQSLGGAAANYGANAGNIAMTGGANQANALLSQGNIRASQYGQIGSALGSALGGGFGNYLNPNSTASPFFNTGASYPMGGEGE
jgi:hypothetical protein